MKLFGTEFLSAGRAFPLGNDGLVYARVAENVAAHRRG